MFSFEQLMYGDGEKDKVIYILLGGALHGLSLPIMLSVNASTGGSDIVGLIVQKRSKRSSSVAMRIVMLTNVIIVGLSSLAYYLIKRIRRRRWKCSSTPLRQCLSAK